MKKNSKPPEERRRELVDVAARLFAERGYEAVSVRDILDAVHGAPGMFYYYFKSKQDIYLATIEQYDSLDLYRQRGINPLSLTRNGRQRSMAVARLFCFSVSQKK